MLIHFARLGATLAALSPLAVPAATHAQTWPTRPIELIVPWAAGGGVDTVARILAQTMSAELGQPIVVANRDGAAGTIGFNVLAGAPPDGYVLGGGPTTPIANSPYLVKGARYQVESFEYICQYFENVFALAVPADSRFKTAADLLAAAKAAPGTLTYGHAGAGSIPHLAAENFGEALGLKFQGVPFRGDAQMLPVLLKGELDFASTALSSIRGQNVRVLAVFADTRRDHLPDVPVARELGVARSVPPGHNGLFAPKGLGKDVREKLEAACASAVKSDAVKRAIGNAGGSVNYLDGEAFQKQTIEDYAFKGDLIRRLGLDAK